MNANRAAPTAAAPTPVVTSAVGVRIAAGRQAVVRNAKTPRARSRAVARSGASARPPTTSASAPPLEPPVPAAAAGPWRALADLLRSEASASARRRAVREARPSAAGVRALLDEARSSRRRDPAAAARVARSALAVARAGGDVARVAEASHVLGQAELLLGRPRHALRRQRVAAESADPTLRLAVAIESAASLALLGYESEARSALANARRLARGSKRAAIRATVDVTEANLLVRLDRDADALALYARARAALLRSGAPAAALATIDLNRANALANLNRFAPADRLYRRVLAFREASGDGAAALQVRYNRAYLHYRAGRLEVALAEMAALRDAFGRAGDERHVALCDLDLAEIHLRTGVPASAAGRASAAAEALDRLGLAHDAARARLFLATATHELGDGAGARAAMERARDELRNVGAAAWEAVALFHLAEIDAETGLFERARRRAEEAAERLRGLGLQERAGRAQVLAARMDTALGASRAAGQRLDALEERLRGLHAPWLRCELHREWAAALVAADRLREARTHALEAVRILDAHRPAVPADEHLGAYLARRDSLHRYALDLVVRAAGRDATDTAFRLVQGAKAGVRPLDGGSGVGGPATPAGARSLRERDLAADLDGLTTRMPSTDSRRQAGEARRSDRMAADRDRRLASLRRSSALRRVSSGPPDRERAPSAARLRAGLPPDVTLVEYYLGADRAYAFVASRGRLRVEHWTAPRERVRDLVARWLASGGASDEPPSRSEGAPAPLLAPLDALQATLLAPIESALRTRRLVFVPHGEAAAVPFHALRKGRHALVDEHDVAVAATTEGWLRRLALRPPALGRPLVVTTDDRPSAEDEAEARAVVQRWPRARSRIGARIDASNADPLAGCAAARLVHVAGSPTAKSPTLERLCGARLRADAVVLGGPAPADGTDPLAGARAFLDAGARAVFARLAPTRPEPAKKFLETLVESLPEVAPAAAFRRAAVATRAAFPRERDWACFALVGNASPTEAS